MTSCRKLKSCRPRDVCQDIHKCDTSLNHAKGTKYFHSIFFSCLYIWFTIFSFHLVFFQKTMLAIFNAKKCVPVFSLYSNIFCILYIKHSIVNTCIDYNEVALHLMLMELSSYNHSLPCDNKCTVSYREPVLNVYTVCYYWVV